MPINLYNKPIKITNNSAPLISSNRKLTAQEFNELIQFLNDNFAELIAPEDGQTYGRRDGNWEIVTGGGGGSLTLGETSTTAYRGDRGKIAYDHSQIDAANPHGVTPGLIAGFVSAVRDTLLTGFSSVASAAVVAGDTVLEAIEKLQAQITGLNSQILRFQDETETFEFTQSDDFKIDSIVEQSGVTATITLSDGITAYTLGDTVTAFDFLIISVDVVGSVKLNYSNA